MDVFHPLHEASEGDVRAAVHRRLGEGADAWAALAVALREPTLEGEVQAAGTALVQALVAGGTLLVAGNGGSAAIASHVAAEFIGKCIHDREPLPAVNLAESLSSVTAVGNDYGFDQIFRRGVAALGRRGDVLLAMSTSGTSPNVLQALLLARERGLLTVALTGAKGRACAARRTTCSSYRPRTPRASRRCTCCGPTLGAKRSTCSRIPSRHTESQVCAARLWDV
ncbi:SIS domain-containing protein [Allobranchiibius sp. GilTou73]|uniref:D-sedoheptulose-7-phosphate isomerase n=1 Tax=Allobranchiibius sp. GilTou73 TaxID=2904523 RepID=UPI001F19C9D0|nr:SIS domain-containing protein [Allobranchiibius sp. GilTou73]UIJ33833.1 SIS domain-containing protein [Allobranchiibius sp. GilTou73]